MFRWRFGRIGLLLRDLGSLLRLKKGYPQRYEKTLMRWGSGLFWVYLFQCIFGIFITIDYCLAFDTGLPGVIHLWWETAYGSFLVRLHSEFGNLVFLFIYGHIFTKLWTSVDSSDADGYATWVSGSMIFVLSYVAGVTGAIMPCSTLSEVTATITGSAINSVIYVKFDFLETILIPGMVLNEDAIFRTFVVHACVPLGAWFLGFLHMILLHKNKYSGAGGFKRMAWLPRFRGTRRWYYSNRYWSRAIGTWFRMFLGMAIIRFVADLFWPHNIGVVYSFCNFEYWPINENIDFALAIPHWYLRPLMGSLVTIPHHYLGFIYIVLYFLVVIFVPWFNERGDDDAWGPADNADSDGWVTTRWDTTHSLIFSSFLFAAVFTCAIIPTGRYFIDVGSMDTLVLAYWLVIGYVLFFARAGFYTIRWFFRGNY